MTNYQICDALLRIFLPSLNNFHLHSTSYMTLTILKSVPHKEKKSPANTKGNT